MNVTLSQILRRSSSLLASLVLAFQLTLPMAALADGNGSPNDCLDNTPNIIGSISQSDDLASYTVGTGKVVEGVCIKSGSNMFGGNQHSSILTTDGTYENGCYAVSAVGTQTVTVTREGNGSDCQEISHIDVLVSSAVDYCDPSQKPSGSIASWLQSNGADGADCFEYEETLMCGSLDVQFTRNDTPYDYSFRYMLGSDTPLIANYLGDGVLPVSFSEDQGGGNVTVTYYAVGPEGDYFSGFGIPNIWDGNGKTVDVNTDCQKDPITGSISGYKWNDLDGDGNVDNEPKLSGWTIFLDENNNQILDNNELSDVTDGNGEYSFSNLPAGDYTICEVMQTGWIQTEPGTQSGCTTTTIDKPDEEVKRNFGNKQVTTQPSLGAVRVDKQVDHNGDNQYDSLNTNTAAFMWGLDAETTDNVMGSTQTSVSTGSHTVRENTVPGYDLVGWYFYGEDKSCQSPRKLPVSFDVNADQTTRVVLCNQNIFDNTPDPCGPILYAAFSQSNQCGSISGHKFNDVNDNGAWDTGEETLSGWTIELSVCNDANINNIHQLPLLNADGVPTAKTCQDLELIDTMVTDANGRFNFTGLQDGTYWVCEVQRDGWVQTYPGLDLCWEVAVHGEECVVDFGNKADESGNVLGEKPKPQPKVLAETGSPIIQALLVSMTIMTAAGTTLVYTQKQKTS